VLKIHSSSTTGTNPFSILGNLNADIKKGFFGTSANLEAADFKAAATANKVAIFGKTPASGWYSASLNSTGLASVNKTSLTQFRLYFDTATNSNNTADNMLFYSGDGASYKPQLVISYNMP